MFSIRLKELREQHGYKSQQAFADAFGVRQSTVGNWEAGKRSPDIETVLRIADFFGVSVDNLLREEPLALDRGVLTQGLYSYLLKRFGNDEKIAAFMKDRGIKLSFSSKTVGTPVRIPSETLRLLASELGDDPHFLFFLADDVKPEAILNIDLPADFRAIVSVAKTLNPTGLHKLLEYGQDLLSSGKYEKAAPSEEVAAV